MAAIYITEEDNSLSVAGTPSIQGAMVIVADKGRVDTPVTVDKNSLISLYGKPNPKKSTTHYSAMFFLEKAADMLVARTIHTAAEGTVESDSNRTARYAAALVRHKVAVIPESIPDGTYVPDKVIEPYKKDNGYGLTQKDVDSFAFPVYPRSREYKELKNKVAVATENSNLLILNNFNGVKPGDKLSFGESVDDESPVFEILELNIVNVKIPTVTIACAKPDTPMNFTAKSKLRRVTLTVEAFSAPKTVANQANQNTSTVTLNDVSGIESGMTILFGPDTNEKHVVQSVNTGNKQVTVRGTFSKNLTNGMQVRKEKRTYEDVKGDPYILRDFKGSDIIYVSDSDQLVNDGRYTAMTGLTNDETEFLVKKKNIYNEEQNQAVLDKETTTTSDTKIHLMTASEFEERDVLLLLADNQGDWGNKVTVEILESPDYPDDCRILKVYNDGVDTGEKFEVAFKDFVDGLGKQLYVEDVINNNSNYIRVKHNPDAVTADGKPALPLINDYSIWRENPEDIFKVTEIKTGEDCVFGDTDIIVTANTDLEPGTRIKFGNFEQEYKVTGKSSNQVENLGSTTTEYHITIDRGIEVDRIEKGAFLKKFDKQEFKKVQKTDNQILPGVSLNSNYNISGKIGKILDCGANMLTGGHNGSLPDIGDMIQTLNKCFSNREELNVNILLDGGVYNPTYQQRLDTLAQNREDCFAFLSGDPSALDNTDPVQAVIKVRNAQNINSSYSATFPDWVTIYDEYNKKNVNIQTDGLAAALQSVASEGGVWGNVAAGWSSGKLFNVIKPVVTWTEAQREKLLNAQLNPLKKYKSRGLSIWGNKTNLGSRSYLQMRNARFLLLQLNIQLREYLEDIHWTFNDEETRTMVCTTIQDSFWNSYNSVLNDLQVMDRTTSTDVDAGSMKIYVAIQPKGVTENIYVTLGIFSNSRSIETE